MTEWAGALANAFPQTFVFVADFGVLVFQQPAESVFVNDIHKFNSARGQEPLLFHWTCDSEPFVQLLIGVQRLSRENGAVVVFPVRAQPQSEYMLSGAI